jgi:ArsR family transcriptional regulator
MKKEESAEICKAMSDENRLRIVEMLTKGEMCACDLLEKLEITQPTLSHHMKVLSECGLVNIRKDGKWSHYSLNCDTLTSFREYINTLSCTCKEKKECSCK